MEERVYDLLIIDDVFPHPASGFRIAEFNAYFDHVHSLRIFGTGAAVHLLGNQSYKQIRDDYLQRYPERAEQLIDISTSNWEALNDGSVYKAAYFCFLNNVYAAIDLLEEMKIPFAFELYPGGGFARYTALSNQKLRRVLQSPMFRRVIVTQDIIREYLLKHEFCREEQIEMIFGVVMPEWLLHMQPQINDRPVLKVCFAAMRYTPEGRDKGYDVYLQTVQLLAKNPNLEFHVAGSFDETVIPLEGLENKVHFHGVLKNRELSVFLQDMDIIVSPNMNNGIARGTFDGFPTATCIEAGLNGVLMMCTDPLKLNNGRFVSGEDIEIINRDARRIASKITYYESNRDILHRMIERQYRKIQDLYSADIQVGRRIAVIEILTGGCPTE